MQSAPLSCLCGRPHPCPLHSAEAIARQQAHLNGRMPTLFDAEPSRPVVDVRPL